MKNITHFPSFLKLINIQYNNKHNNKMIKPWRLTLYLSATWERLIFEDNSSSWYYIASIIQFFALRSVILRNGTSVRILLKNQFVPNFMCIAEVPKFWNFQSLASMWANSSSVTSMSWCLLTASASRAANWCLHWRKKKAISPWKRDQRTSQYTVVTSR